MQRRLPIFYNALLLTGVNLLLRLVSTSFQVYLSGRIGAAGIGLLQLVLSVGSMAMVAGMAGARTATMYLTAEELGKNRPGSVKWILSNSFTYSIAISGSISVLLYFFAPALAQHWVGDPAVTPALRLFAYFVPVSCLCGVMTGYFTAANRIGALAAVEICEQLCSILITVSLLTLFAGSDPAKACESVIFGSGTSSCLTLGCLLYLRIKENVPAAARLPMGKRLLKTAVPLGLADDLKTGINTVENLMVPKRLSLYSGALTPLAAFGTVCGMVFPVLMFPAAILFGLAELLIPELARCAAAGSTKRIRYLTKRSLRVAMLYGCILCGIMFLASDPLCHALYGETDAGRYLRLYALLIPMLYCDAITDAMIKGLGQQTASVRYNILTSSLDVALLFILLPKYGMLGYYASFLFTHLLNFVLSIRRLIQISQCKLSAKESIQTLLCTGTAIWIAAHLSNAIIGAVAFVTVLLCLLSLWGVLRREDVHWVKGLICAKEHK